MNKHFMLLKHVSGDILQQLLHNVTLQHMISVQYSWHYPSISYQI